MSQRKLAVIGRTRRDDERVVQEITDFARELSVQIVEDCKREIARKGSIPTDFVAL